MEKGVSESHYVTAVDGCRLFIRLKGNRPDRPPLLYLHGGPGGGLNLAAFETCAGPCLERSFSVAYLHQRGVLRSRGTGKTHQSLALHLEDIRTAASFLCRRFQQARVYLLGHSWGGFTGCAFLSRHASMVAGIVAVCPVVSFPGVQRELHTLVSKMVQDSGNDTAYRELSSIGKPPYPDIDDFIRLQGLAAESLGNPYRHLRTAELARYTGYSIDEAHCLAVQTRIAAALWPELYLQDVTDTLNKLATPVLMVACEADGSVPWTSVHDAFRAYGADRSGVVKQWLLLKDCNHLPFTEPAAGQTCMDRIVAFLELLETGRKRVSESGTQMDSD